MFTHHINIDYIPCSSRTLHELHKYYMCKNNIYQFTSKNSRETILLIAQVL